jgi:cytochrome c oxidase assembly factor CtaG
VRVGGGLTWLRPWLTLVAAVLTAILLVPPVGTLARQYVFAEALQFVLFATAVPALLVLGAPWRLLGMGQPGRLRQLRHSSRLARLLIPQPAGSGAGQAMLALVVFLGVVIGWRLPVSVDALARVPGLAVAEMAVLVTAGSVLWLELVESPPMLPRLSRPGRAVFAALPMWAIWVLAYILGFSRSAWFAAYHGAAGGLGTIMDQQLATAVMWAVPAICFIPVIYAMIVGWLHEGSDPNEELGKITGPEGPAGQAGPAGGAGPGLPRPPRGWQRPRGKRPQL